jgi:magnesium-transporting ATPase (P-type)
VPTWRRILAQFQDPFIYLVLVFAQLFNCFNARAEDSSAFHHLFVNPWLWGAIALSVVLQVAVVNVRFLNIAFGTVAAMFIAVWDVVAVSRAGVRRDRTDS